MTRALLLCLLGVLLMSAGAGWEWGWGWAALVAGAALLATGLLLDVDKGEDREAA